MRVSFLDKTENSLQSIRSADSNGTTSKIPVAKTRRPETLK